MGIVKHGLGQFAINHGLINRMSRVNKNNSFALVQFLPNGQKGFMAKISVIRAIPRIQNYTVGVQLVHTASDFLETGLSVEKRREDEEEAVVIGALITNASHVVVAVLSERKGLGRISDE